MLCQNRLSDARPAETILQTWGGCEKGPRTYPKRQWPRHLLRPITGRSCRYVFDMIHLIAWGITAGRPSDGGYGSPPEQKRDHGKFLTCQTPVLYIRIHASKRETDAAPPFALGAWWPLDMKPNNLMLSYLILYLFVSSTARSTMYSTKNTLISTTVFNSPSTRP